jgi:riboflavin biosynthesis pyrimidine reductase
VGDRSVGGERAAASVFHVELISSRAAGPVARERVYSERARSDAVIIGGQTLRHDNPRLTTRRPGGHTPARIIISRSMDLPEVCTHAGFIE